jgi:hypothetical protein
MSVKQWIKGLMNINLTFPLSSKTHDHSPKKIPFLKSYPEISLVLGLKIMS